MTRPIPIGRGFKLGADGKLKRISAARNVSAKIRERKSKRIRIGKQP